MSQLFNELKRRNVVRVAMAYAVVGWVVLQFLDIVAPLLGLPEVFQKGVLLLLLLGFPPGCRAVGSDDFDCSN